MEDTATGFAQRVLLLQASDGLWATRSRRGLEHAAWTFPWAVGRSMLRRALGVQPDPQNEEETESDREVGPQERMVELARDGMLASNTQACSALAQTFTNHGEKQLFGDHKVGLQACALATALAKPHSPLGDHTGAHLFACPLTRGTEKDVGDRLKQVHRGMLAAGYVRFDGSAGDVRVDPEPIDARGAGTHETRAWPRPFTCASRPNAILDLKERLKRPYLSKLVNRKRRLEFRPILKAGNVMMHDLLPCLQPDEWEKVRQAEDVPKNTTVLVLQRDPISRFAASLGELMERVFLHRCPKGPCNDEFNGFKMGEGVNTTLWYPVAKQLFDSRHFGGEKLRELVRAAALDVSCNLNYYAGEELASQSGLQLQGRMYPDTPVRIFDLEELGDSIASLLESDFVKTILGDDPPARKEEVKKCLGWDTAKSVNIELNSLHSSPRAMRMRAAVRRNQHEDPFADLFAGLGAEHKDVSLRTTEVAGETQWTQYSDAPTAQQLVSAIEADPATYTILEAAFAQDIACSRAARLRYGSVP